MKSRFLPFSGHPRGHWGQKRQKLSISLKMTPRSWKFAQRCSFWSQILCCRSFRTNQKFWLFWGNLGDKNSQKLPISLKLPPPPPRSCKFAQRNNFSAEIWYCHPCRRIHNFWLFMGHHGGEVGVQKSQNLSIPLIIPRSCKFAHVDHFS